MSFFSNFDKKGPPAKPKVQIRTVKTTVKKSTTSTTTKPQLPKNSTPKVPSRSQSRVASTSLSRSKPSSHLSPSETPSSHPKRIVRRKRAQAAPVHFASSSDDDESDDSSTSRSRKRTKTSVSVEPDVNRRLRSEAAFASEDGDKALKMVHAVDVVHHEKAKKYVPLFGSTTEGAEIRLQYPSATKSERYPVVKPHDHDDFSPIEDIIHTIELTLDLYLPESESAELLDGSKGLPRRLRRALTHDSETDFRDAVEEYNKLIRKYRLNGVVAKVLDEMHTPPLPLVERILTQIYSRTVSPRVGKLRQYENGTDNVYGELLPRFISEFFKETGLQSHHTFIDLGSGVANVILQAALEIGCKSYGCEMMDNACDLAELQEAEFKARCRLWGIKPGPVHLERGDFLTNTAIGKVLQKADVVLVNNQAFTPKLNDALMNLFLDLKEGCQIVSLRSFVPVDHKITARNLNSPVNLLEVRSKQYWSDYVSWTDAGGTYFIARKDSSKLREFAKRDNL
ncbi:MAG: Nucleosomal histone H3-Lys79 methylase [Cirrosporium novae-zelandiae]|nr:MAG: Nucleosomal histone H3-Lys79 methylase [Cirrosporium novae-zelandiae]